MNLSRRNLGSKNGISNTSLTSSEKSISLFFKILINYAQMLTLVSSLQLKWPSYLNSYFQTSNNMGSFSTQVISFDCLNEDYNIQISSIYIKPLAILLVYIFLFALALMIFLVERSCFRSRFKMSKLLIMIIVLNTMIQPNSLRETADILNCQNVIDKKYLVEKISLECYTDEHQFWVFFFKKKIFIFFYKILLDLCFCFTSAVLLDYFLSNRMSVLPHLLQKRSS